MTSTLLHHGAAASSSSHTVLWIDDNDSDSSSIIYSSHGIINICQKFTPTVQPNEPVWSVVTTLRTSTISDTTSTTKRVITALCAVRNTEGIMVGLASGFSDGTVTLWHKLKDGWKEQVLLREAVLPESTTTSNNTTVPSITDMDGIRLMKTGQILLVVCSSTGVVLLRTTVGDDEASSTTLAPYAANTVRLQPLPSKDAAANKSSNSIMLLVGTAAPRHNKIHVYHFNMASNADVRHVGYLLGHEDWLTDFAWHTMTGVDDSADNNSSALRLASASQDAKIRLWQFQTTQDETSATVTILADNDDNSESDEEDIDEDDDEENGEARLEWQHSSSDGTKMLTTRVVLEALLYGHEEAVTSVAWHPQPQTAYRQDSILLSSSMDRTLLIWACVVDVWTPLQRVGAAGGILGGSIGSTLLGFVGVLVDPRHGAALVGHAYGGALHVWTLEDHQAVTEEEEVVSTEELALRNRWNATPCITGHFNGVTDCCWEASTGDYLLTVSDDQTCRLWGSVEATKSTATEKENIWVELARPQVHGYDLTTLTSISTRQHRHIIVTGADEKEIRVFDAPQNALTLLQQVTANRESSSSSSTNIENDGLERVERAYIPSLGLSNKASATDGAKEDTEGIRLDSEEDGEQIHLPLERDLGAVSLWPEVGKLYGHNTELYCLTSTLTAQSGPRMQDSPFVEQVLVASSAKARDVQDASIRIWNVESGKCVQVLSGGHKSTVASLAFSPDGRFLASSGKDRRLCIWRRQKTETDDEPLFVLGAAVDSAHKRILWSVHFCPFDPTLLATGSRDGTIKVWRIVASDNDSSATATVVHTFESSFRAAGKKAEAVTAVSFAPTSITSTGKGEALLAVGLENGLIEIWGVSDKEYRLVHAIEPISCHFSTITKLCWRPVSDDGDATLILASASTDHGCRLYKFDP